ncbi:MAG: DUF4253 domain-containing protein [Pseudomonadota bacterium]
MTFEIVTVPGRVVPETFRKIDARPDVTPVVLGASDRLDDLLYPHTPKREPETVLEIAEALDVADWLRKRENTQRTAWKENGFAWPPRGAFEGLPYRGDVLSQVSRDLVSNELIDSVAIGIFPTTIPAEVPAYLDAGGWNAFPVSEVHVALMRKWSAQYGARLVGHETDLLSFAVERPPQDKESAYALAMEQYLYCNDVVDQGYETLDALAASLLDSAGWFLWWD